MKDISLKGCQNFFIKLICVFLLICVSISLGYKPSAFAVSIFAGGSGTSIDPYQVSTPAQLNLVRSHLNKHFIQINDIDMTLETQSEEEWLPIGTSSTTAFSGTYDGNGHKIIGLKINHSQKSNDTNLHAGLFGYIAAGGIVKNLVMEKSVIDFEFSFYTDNTNSAISHYSSLYLGGIAGYNEGTISNCYNTGSVSGITSASGISNYATSVTGGIVGGNVGTIMGCYNIGEIIASSSSYAASSGGIAGTNLGTISDCHNEGNINALCAASVSSFSHCGGIVGINSKEISRCYNIGSVSALNESKQSYAYTYAGGIAGENDRTISNCYNVGDASAIAKSLSPDYSSYSLANSYTGGIAGFNNQTITGSGGHVDGIINNSYSTGSIAGSASSISSKADNKIGAIAGMTYQGLTNCYWNLDAKQSINGISMSDDRKKGIGKGTDNTISKNTSQMKTNDFLESLNVDNVWYTDSSDNNNGMPILHFISNALPSFPPSVKYDNAKIAVSECGSEYYMYTNGTVFGQPDWRMIVDITAGWDHVVGLRADGSLESDGDNANNQCNVELWRKIVAVSAGAYHTVGLRSDGTVISTKPNINSNYGQGDTDLWTNISMVSAGSYHTVGLKSDGTVVATGSNSFGQCNVGSWTNIVKVSAGATFTVGLKKDGTVVATGNNLRGQCNVTSWNTVVDIYAQSSRTIAVLFDGSMVVAGRADDFIASKIKNVKCTAGYVDSALFLDKTNTINGISTNLERGTMVINNYYPGTYEIYPKIELKAIDTTYQILFTTDGRDPLDYGFIYKEPFIISDNTTLRIVTVKDTIAYEVDYDYVLQPTIPDAELLEILAVKNGVNDHIDIGNFKNTTSFNLDVNNRSGYNAFDISIAFYSANNSLLNVTATYSTAVSRGISTIPLVLSKNAPITATNMKVFIWGSDLKPFDSWELLCDG